MRSCLARRHYSRTSQLRDDAIGGRKWNCQRWRVSSRPRDVCFTRRMETWLRVTVFPSDCEIPAGLRWAEPRRFFHRFFPRFFHQFFHRFMTALVSDLRPEVRIKANCQLWLSCFAATWGICRVGHAQVWLKLGLVITVGFTVFYRQKMSKWNPKRLPLDEALLISSHGRKLVIEHPGFWFIFRLKETSLLETILSLPGKC